MAGVNALLSVKEDTLNIGNILEKLASSLADEKGRIDYGAFVASFSVVRAYSLVHTQPVFEEGKASCGRKGRLWGHHLGEMGNGHIFQVFTPYRYR